jgi:hypothetical protein
MKIFPPILRVLCFLAVAAGSATFTQAAVILQEGFDGAPGDTNPTFYTGNYSSQGTEPTLVVAPESTGISGTAQKFYGGSYNSIEVATVSPVTLSHPGDFISFTVNYASGSAPAAGTDQIGILNYNNTLLTGDFMGVAGNSYDDFGYLVSKNIGTGQTTNDVTLKKENATPGGSPTTLGGIISPSTTNLATVSSNISGSVTTLNTVSLTLTLAPNGTDINASYTFDGFTTSFLISGANVSTYTFDEITFTPSDNSSTTAYVDNYLVTTNVAPVPEPPALGFLAIAVGAACFRRRQQRIAKEG